METFKSIVTTGVGDFSNKVKQVPRLLAVILALLVIVFVAGGIWFVAQNSFRKPSNPTTAWANLKAKATTSSPGFYLGETQTPRLISGKFSGYESQGTPSKVALAFLKDNKDLYQIRDVANELKLDGQEKNANFTAVRFVQQDNSVPVLDGAITVRVDPDLKVDSVSSSYVPGINVVTTPKIGKAEAIKSSGEDSNSPASLVIYSPEVYNTKGQAELAWKITGSSQDVIVSATTGKLLTSYGTVFDAQNREIYTSEEKPENPGILWMNEQGSVSGLPPGKPDHDAQAAYSNLAMTYNFYLTELIRDSWDGQGASIAAAVHYRLDPNQTYWNASWKDNEKRIRFGTNFGDVIDVVAHEFTHGVISTTSQLAYQGESGATNESLADIFGTFAKIFNGGQGWLIYADSKKSVLRDLKNPSNYAQPTSLTDPNYQKGSSTCDYYNDYCGVHQNSSIISKVAQLIDEGGYNNGQIVFPLSREKTEQLFYYLMTKLLKSYSQFSDVKFEAVEAAKGGFVADNGKKYLFSKLEISSIINAFASVGIGAPDLNFDDVMDDKENIGSGIAILDFVAGQQTVFQQGCPTATEASFYVLPSVYGQAQVVDKQISYQYVGESNSYSGQYVATGNFYQAGELFDAPWYQFKLTNLPKPGKITVQALFIGNNNLKVYSSPLQIDVVKCIKVEVAHGNFTQKFQNPAVTNVTPILLSPAATPTPTHVPIPTTTTAPTVNLTVEADERLSGFVASNWKVGSSPVAGELYPGSRAFLSFNLSQIPVGATIKSAQLIIGAPMSYGDPFSLGQLSILDLYYNTLDVSDYVASGTTIGSLSSSSLATFDVTANVRQDLLSHPNFQIRLQFDKYSSDNGTTDYLIFPVSKMKLSVNYTD